MMDEVLKEIEKKILGKRGMSAREWVRLRSKNWDELNPVIVRDDTLMEIFNIVHELRLSLLNATKETQE